MASCHRLVFHSALYGVTKRVPDVTKRVPEWEKVKSSKVETTDGTDSTDKTGRGKGKVSRRLSVKSVKSAVKNSVGLPGRLRIMSRHGEIWDLFLVNSTCRGTF